MYFSTPLLIHLFFHSQSLFTPLLTPTSVHSHPFFTPHSSTLTPIYPFSISHHPIPHSSLHPSNFHSISQSTLNSNLHPPHTPHPTIIRCSFVCAVIHHRLRSWFGRMTSCYSSTPSPAHALLTTSRGAAVLQRC